MTVLPGTPATYHAGSDRYAMIVVAVERNGRLLLVDWLHHVTDTLGDNPTPDALADYATTGLERERRSNFGQVFRRFTLRTDGRYRAQGSDGRGFTLSLGHAEDYRDPSF